MRILGIDHGAKRIGVAVSDELGLIALPLEFIPAEPLDEAYRHLGRLTREKDVGRMVVGWPRNMDGTCGPAAESVRLFVEGLRQHVDIPIVRWDERLTSVQANRALSDAGVKGRHRRGKVDQTAAAILLQSYLDAAAMNGSPQ